MKKDKMDGPTGDVTFLFQLGLVRDSVTVDASLLTLKTLKEVAIEFITRKALSRPGYSGGFRGGRGGFSGRGAFDSGKGGSSTAGENSHGSGGGGGIGGGSGGGSGGGRRSSGNGTPIVIDHDDRYCMWCGIIIPNCAHEKPTRCPFVNCLRELAWMGNEWNLTCKNFRRCRRCLDVGRWSWEFCFLCGRRTTQADRMDAGEPFDDDNDILFLNVSGGSGGGGNGTGQLSLEYGSSTNGGGGGGIVTTNSITTRNGNAGVETGSSNTTGAGSVPPNPPAPKKLRRGKSGPSGL